MQEIVSVSVDDTSPEGDALMEEMIERLTPQWRMQNLHDQRAQLRAPTTEQEVVCLKGLDALIKNCAGLDWNSHVLTDRIETAERQLKDAWILFNIMPDARRGFASREGSRRGGSEQAKRSEKTRSWCLKRVAQIKSLNVALSDTAALERLRRELAQATASRSSCDDSFGVPSEVLAESHERVPSLRTMRRWLRGGRLAMPIA